MPSLSRLAVLAEPAEIPNWDEFWSILNNNAKKVGVRLQTLKIRGPDDFTRAFSDAQRSVSRAF